MSGLFTSVFSPGVSVTDGSQQSQDDGGQGAAESTEAYAEEDASTGGSEQSGSSSDNSLAADSDLDLRLEVAITNEVEMTYIDDEGNVSTYSRSDELTVGADAGAAAETVLTGSNAYDSSEDFTG